MRFYEKPLLFVRNKVDADIDDGDDSGEYIMLFFRPRGRHKITQSRLQVPHGFL